jgi:hypothetical protein
MRRGFLIGFVAAVALGTLAVSGAARTPGGDGTPAPAAFRLADGSSRPATHAVVWDETTPVLRRTESWWHGGFSCHVEDRLVCERGNGSISVGAGGVGGASSAEH